MTDKQPLSDSAASICKVAYDEFSRLDDSLAGLIRKNKIEARDFIILSFVSDQGALDTTQISHILGLSEDKTGKCIQRLIDAGLVKYRDAASKTNGHRPIRVTAAGQVVVDRVQNFEE